MYLCIPFQRILRSEPVGPKLCQIPSTAKMHLYAENIGQTVAVWSKLSAFFDLEIHLRCSIRLRRIESNYNLLRQGT